MGHLGFFPFDTLNVDSPDCFDYPIYNGNIVRNFRNMIDDYKALAVFVTVADVGSFSGAAKRLRLSTSVVSHHVSRLETKLGVSLFFRSTRSLSLTPEGTAVLPSARKMMQNGQDAIDILSQNSAEPVGALRITMPEFGQQGPIPQAIWAFARAHPMVAITLHCNDKPIDLVKEGFDIGIRLGRLADSAMKSRKIGDFQRILVTTPQYLATRGPIETIEDVLACDWISIALLPNTLPLVKGDDHVLLAPERPRLEVDTIIAAKSAILSGMGVQHLPLSEAKRELEDGTLVELLPDWNLPQLGIYAVWPDIGPQKALTRHLIDFLADFDLTG